MEANGGGQGPEKWEDDGLAMVVSCGGLVAWVPAQAVAQNGGRDALAAALRQGTWVPAEAAARTGWLPSPGMLVVEGDYALAVARHHGWIRRSVAVQGQAAAPRNSVAANAPYLPFLYLSAQEVAATEAFRRDHRSRTPMPLFLFVAPDFVGYSLRAVDIGDRVSHPVLSFNRRPNHEVLTLVKVRGSCAGILLLSFPDRLYACNPCTRRWVRLPALHIAHEIIGFYATTGRAGFGCQVLYHDRDESGCSYWIFTLGTAARRCIGRPGPVKLDRVLAAGIASSYELSPILFRSFLHWLPRLGHDILRFDTVAETFSMIPPPSVPVVGCQLFEIDQHLAMTVKSPGTATVDVWVRSNMTEIWSRRYCIHLPVDAITRSGTDPRLVNVLAVAQGRNALVCCARILLQCDALGAVLQSYQLGDHITLLSGVHTIQESLLLYPNILPMWDRDAVDGDPPFFQNQ